MALRLGDTAADFTQESTGGTINFHEWIGDSWAVLFSHPKDFTPVCTTELGEGARLKPEFEKRNTKVIGLSVDPLEYHKAWAGDIKETQGHALNFPLLADSDRKVAQLYDMVHPKADNTLTVRSVFVIHPNKKIRLKLPAGHSFVQDHQTPDPADTNPPLDTGPHNGIIPSQTRV